MDCYLCFYHCEEVTTCLYTYRKYYTLCITQVGVNFDISSRPPLIVGGYSLSRQSQWCIEAYNPNRQQIVEFLESGKDLHMAIVPLLISAQGPTSEIIIHARIARGWGI